MLLIAFTSPHHQDVTNTTNIKLSPLPPPIHHSNHLHEYHLYKYHRYKHPPPPPPCFKNMATEWMNVITKLTALMNQICWPSNEFRLVHQVRNMCHVFVLQHFTVHCVLQISLLRLTVYCKLRLFVFKIPDNKRLISQKIFEQFNRHGS